MASLPGWKRKLDLLWVLLVLPVTLVLAPFLFCWIKLVSPGPCLFRQTRIGRGGRPFTIYKFRTMTPEADANIHDAHVTHLITANQPMIKLDNEDDRLIRGACFIRTAGLDELPQLINVLRGEMSAVGPRPCVPTEFGFYDEDHFRRFAVAPGITGSWQVKQTRFTTFREMMDMDLEYVDHLSLRADLRILLKTPFVLIGRILSCIRDKVSKPAHRTIGRLPALGGPQLPYAANTAERKPTQAT
jgi:lipopolysaccharide/colanic/teichoic acid biosynthesis glycosyltransferase